MVIDGVTVAIGAFFAAQSGGLIWKLSDLTRQAKTTNARLEKIETKLFNGVLNEYTTD